MQENTLKAGDLIFVDSPSNNRKANVKGQAILRGDFITEPWSHIALSLGNFTAIHSTTKPDHVEKKLFIELFPPNTNKIRVFRHQNVTNMKGDEYSKFRQTIFGYAEEFIGMSYGKSESAKICSALVKEILEMAELISINNFGETLPLDLFKMVCEKDSPWQDVTLDYKRTVLGSEEYFNLYAAPKLYSDLQQECLKIARISHNELERKITAGVTGKIQPKSGMKSKIETRYLQSIIPDEGTRTRLSSDSFILSKLEPEKIAFFEAMYFYDLLNGTTTFEECYELASGSLFKQKFNAKEAAFMTNFLKSMREVKSNVYVINFREEEKVEDAIPRFQENFSLQMANAINENNITLRYLHIENAPRQDNKNWTVMVSKRKSPFPVWVLKMEAMSAEQATD